MQPELFGLSMQPPSLHQHKSEAWQVANYRLNPFIMGQAQPEPAALSHPECRAG